MTPRAKLKLTPQMDHKFTEQIRQWLETHEDERDYAVGCLFLKMVDSF